MKSNFVTGSALENTNLYQALMTNLETTLMFSAQAYLHQAEANPGIALHDLPAVYALTDTLIDYVIDQAQLGGEPSNHEALPQKLIADFCATDDWLAFSGEPGAPEFVKGEFKTYISEMIVYSIRREAADHLSEYLS